MASVYAPISVTESSQVGQVRRAVARLADAAGFSEEQRGEATIVATELATNLAKYGRTGQFFMQPITDGSGEALQFLAIDSGPGIEDLQRSLQDGVSTSGTLGTGLGAVRRMSRFFDIYSVPGQGTVVMAVVGKSRRRRHASAFQCATISTAAPGETVSGDAWRIAHQDGGLSVLIADGLGHGPLAAEAADRAAGVFDDSFQHMPAAYCERAHQALASTRGAAVACAYVAPSGRVMYAGVGNIAGTIAAGETSRGLSSQNGTIGLNVRRVQEFEYALPERGVLVMHSDGLTARWSLATYPALASRHAAVIAGVLYRDCVRGKDDATVVVIKRVA